LSIAIVNMDAIELLEKDHTRIRTLFSDIENTQDFQEIKESFEKLDNVLTLAEQFTRTC